jgi:hypothetical protein
MSLEIDYAYRPKTANIFPVMGCAFLLVQLLSVPAANALEVLTAQELASHCALLSDEPEGVDGQYCTRYIQGFIDGAIATDARVMLNAESALSSSETFTERAMRTRMPSRADRSRAADLAGFCLGDPLPLRDVVEVVVADLAAQQGSAANDEPAMEAVYNSLLKNYPCKQ